jgi:hypothetical protein
MIGAEEDILPAFLGKRMQMAFVVRDLDSALRFWTESMKVGPFIVIEDAMGDRHFIHRGRESPVQATLAFSYIGDTQIEIIAQSNSAPSPYTEFIESGREGLHHIAFWPTDNEASCRVLEQIGFEEVCSIEAAGSTQKVKYYSCPAHLGMMVELAPMSPDRSTYFSGIKALTETWDGSRPVRKFRNRADYMASDDCKI